MLSKENKKALFLLENCSGTEIIKSKNYHEDIESKFIRYAEVFENNEIGFFAKSFHTQSFNRFRLLFIANDKTRLKAISKVVAEHDKHGFIWLSTLSDFYNRGICGNIWHIPFSNSNSQAIIG